MTTTRRLPFDRALLDRRDAILKAAWRCVEPTIGRAVTYTRWRERNSRVAVDLARAGVAVEAVVAAWEQASERFGEPVRELSLVQRELEAAYCQRAGAAAKR